MALLKTILSKLQNKHFLSLAGNGIMSLMSIVTTGLICRAVSIEGFGIWVFFQTTLLLIDTFRSGFITTAFIKFYSGATEERSKEIIGSTWYIALIITTICSLAVLPGVFFAGQIGNQGLKLFFQWFSVSFWVMLPYFIATCVVQAEQRFDRLLFLRSFNQIVFILCIFVLILLHKLDAQSIIYCYLISFALPGIFVLLNGWARIKTLSKKTKSGVRELYNFGKYSVGTTLSANMFRTSDTYIINFMLGPQALAIYNIGQKLMELVEIPLRSFAATGMPELSAAFNQNQRQEVISVMKKYIGMITVLLIPACIGGVFLADLAVGIIGGKQYLNTEAANVFRLFMTFALLYPADRFMALTLDVIHLPQINFYKVLVMLAANIITDFIGIHLTGNVYGVAFATVVPVLIGTAVAYWALCKNYVKFSFLNIYQTGYSESKNFLQTVLIRK